MQQSWGIDAVLEEICEADSIQELGILVECLMERGDSDLFTESVFAAYNLALSGLYQRGAVLCPAEEEQQPAARAISAGRTRGAARRYRLLNANVTWSDRRQVLMLALIMAKLVDGNGEFSEDDMLASIEANADVIGTRQPAKTLWNFYKGSGGFIEHGNIEKL